MEFTEIREVDDIAAYARTFQGRQVFIDTDGIYHYSSQPSFSVSKDDNKLDYEKMFKDSPPVTPSNNLKKWDLDEIDDDDDEPLDKIISEINVSLSKRIESFSSPIIKPKAQKIVSFTIETKEEHDETDDVGRSRKTTDTTMDKKDEEEEIKNERSAKTFEKGDEEFISKSYLETRSIKSFLNTNLKSSLQTRGGSYSLKRGEMRAFRIFFLGNSVNIITPINISSRVHDAIIQCLDAFKANTNLDQSILRFPERPEAYDIKLTLDGFALDRTKELKSFKFGKELFITEVHSFDPNSPTKRANSIEEAEIMLDIKISFSDDPKTLLTSQLSNKALLKEIYTALSVKGINSYHPQNFNIRVFYRDDAEKRFKESKNFLDLNLPLRNLKGCIKNNTLELEFVRKQFADEPIEKVKQNDLITREMITSVQEQNNTVPHLLNEVSANRYEEFEVVKINDSGKRQVRIMGIDGFKIYNYTKKYKEEHQQGGMTDLLNGLFFSKFGTMKPERLLSDVISVKETSSNSFQLEVREDGSIKHIDYEVVDKNMAAKIVAKLKYLKEQEAKTKYDV